MPKKVWVRRLGGLVYEGPLRKIFHDGRLVEFLDNFGRFLKGSLCKEFVVWVWGVLGNVCFSKELSISKLVEFHRLLIMLTYKDFHPLYNGCKEMGEG